MTVEMTESCFGMIGTWSFLLTDTDNGLAIVIHEDSITDGFMMRGILSLIGRDGNLKLQLKAIEIALNETDNGQ